MNYKKKINKIFNNKIQLIKVNNFWRTLTNLTLKLQIQAQTQLLNKIKLKNLLINNSPIVIWHLNSSKMMQLFLLFIQLMNLFQNMLIYKRKLKIKKKKM